ncbi:MAG: hypothetical protein FJY60_08625 [Betaproteobacteria bacterium]|nr:hypothetical protein [Betaproteobacteria bacterium]
MNGVISRMMVMVMLGVGRWQDRRGDGRGHVMQAGLQHLRMMREHPRRPSDGARRLQGQKAAE